MEKETLLDQAKKINTPSNINDEEYDVLIAYMKDEIELRQAMKVLGVKDYGKLSRKVLYAFKRYIRQNGKNKI